jgi:hypothetical protein
MERAAGPRRRGLGAGRARRRTVRQEGEWAFWDVRDPERAVIIHLADERFARLVIEVDEPEASAAAIRQAIAGATSRARPGRPR